MLYDFYYAHSENSEHLRFFEHKFRVHEKFRITYSLNSFEKHLNIFILLKILVSRQCQGLFMMESGEELKQTKNTNVKLIWMEKQIGLTQKNFKTQVD